MYEKLNTLAKVLVSRIVGQSDETEESTINRLQSISGRHARLQIGENGVTDDYLTGRLRHHTTTEIEADPAISHWCRDPGRYQRQNIRQGEQFKGAQQCFEIDPLSKLPD